MISTTITIIFSVLIGDGEYYPVTLGLIADCGSEINAMIVQTICAMLYGAAWAGASVIWEMENWSLLRQTVTHLMVCSLSALPIAYFMHWMPRNLGGVLGYFGIFASIYLGIWFCEYFSMKKRIQQINEKVPKG